MGLPMTRRSVLRAGAAGVAAMALAGNDPARAFAQVSGNGDGAGDRERERHDDGIVDRSIVSLHKALREGELTSVELVNAYLERIAAFDRSGPTVNSIIELNPDALEIAAALDRERHKKGGGRGLLHGIPIVVKDNIATADKMETTAGSLALVGAKVPADAALIANLRRAGAIVLAKTNLSEWANFRSFTSNSGWSGRGGLTANPYLLTHNACGSSSGSGAAASASFAAAAVGTETDGSVTCPASICGIVGLKPTHGLVSGNGIVPLAHSQDTAGPMGRTVTDVAALLAAMTGEPANRYTSKLRKGSLRGARVGVARQFFGRLVNDPNDPNVLADPVALRTAPVWEAAIAALRDAGATVVDPIVVADADKYGATELTVLLYEFKADLNAYLASLVSSPVRTLAEVIAFNTANAATELQFFDQSIMEAAEATTGLSTQEYLDALANDITTSRAGLDAAFAKDDLDAIVYPTTGPAWETFLGKGDIFDTIGFTSAPAVSGYPHVTVPAGFDGVLPIGFSIVGPAGSDARILSYAYAFEQETKARRAPKFLTNAAATPASAAG
jgi:amidase